MLFYEQVCFVARLKKQSMADKSFPRERRVRRQVEFDRVYGSNVYAADQVLVMSACQNELNYSRLGVSVSRRVGNAVVRNRWKRCIREAFRTQQDRLPKGIDLVVRPKRGAVCDSKSIRTSLPKLAARVAKRLGKRQP